MLRRASTTTIQSAVSTSDSAPPAAVLTVLVIDDEPQIRRIVRSALQAPSTRVLDAKDGASGIDLAAKERPQLIVLDLGLPDMSGVAVCTALRELTRSPILVLSARHSDSEKVALLDAGADDYVTKPFSTTELQARVRALLRRAARSETADADTRIESGDLVIDLVARTVTVRGAYVHVTRTEWEVLRTLATQAGRTLTHQQLFRQVWSGRAYGDAQQYLRVQVAHLRRKIEADVVRPRYIVTEPGVGYRFNVVEAPRPRAEE
jgi:two-component system KDP operon response regulator KdpE